MPLELGLFLGCKRFGPPNQSNKRTLVLDSDQYRYRAFISDILVQNSRARTSGRMEENLSVRYRRFATGFG